MMKGDLALADLPSLIKDAIAMDYTDNREKRNAHPNVRTVLPTLSPAFINADDAARFAHQLIADYRTVEYGGAILQDTQGRYFATRPVRGRQSSFDPTLVISTDAKGMFITPPGYTCVALYHSHPANYDKLQGVLKSWPPQDIQTAINSFSTADMVLNRLNAYFAVAHYLSGVNGSLLKYIASGSPLEEALTERIALDTSEGKLTFPTIAQYVQAAARVGTLRVLQSTEIWGAKPGLLRGDFKVFTPSESLDIAPVIVQQPAFGPISESIEQAVKEMRARVNQTSDSVYGIILEHKGQPVFVASEPVSGELDFSLSKIFPSTASTPGLIPPYYEVAGLYCRDGFYRDPSLVPVQEPSVFKNFLFPQALANGVKAAQALAGPSAARAVPLFICTTDGAVLKYVSTLTPAEQTLLAPLTQGEGLAITRELLSGVTLTSAFIRELSRVGELSVLHTSDLWSREGRVTPAWQPYDGFYRRAMSPSFISADDAARYAHEQIAGRVDKVYGGLIYQRLDNRFVATEPLACHNESFDPACVLPPELIALTPHGCAVVAVYHTHRVHPLWLWRSASQEQVWRNMLEPHELNAAIRDREWASIRYFSARNGTLLKYTPSDSPLERALRTQIAPPVEHPENVRRNAMHMTLRANSIKPVDYVRQVAQAGDLQVVVGSALWGQPGKVAADFKPGAVPAATEAPRPLACSPVFTQLEDAVRYVHNGLTFAQTSQYGVILASLHGDEYVATLPLEGGAFTLDRLFARDAVTDLHQLPPGFKLQAVYVAAPRVAAGVEGLDTRRIYEAFVSPVDFARALALSDSIKAQIGLVPAAAVLYLSSSDGALLRYIDRSSQVQLASGVFREGGQATLDQLTALRLTPLDYVRKVAMAGDLQVIKTNPVWTRAGRVSAGWQPYGLELPAATASSIRFFALGPVFSHPDDAARYEHQHLKHPRVANMMGGVLRHPDYDTYVALQLMENDEPVNVAQMILGTHLSLPNVPAARTVLPGGYAIKSLHFAREVSGQVAGTALETNLLKNMFWPVDICYATRTLHRELSDVSVDFLYLSTDDGGLLRYWRGDKEANDRLCEYVSGASVTYERYFFENSSPTRTPALPSDTLTRVLNSGGLRVLEPSSTWPRTGAVNTRLTVSTQPVAFDYEGTTPGTPVVQLKVGPVRDEL